MTHRSWAKEYDYTVQHLYLVLRGARISKRLTRQIDDFIRAHPTRKAAV